MIPDCERVHHMKDYSQYQATDKRGARLPLSSCEQASRVLLLSA